MALWQLKLILTYYNSTFSRAILVKSPDVPLVQNEFLYGLKCQLDKILDTWESDKLELLVNYLQGELLKGNNCSHLSLFLLWFDVPRPEELRKIIVTGTPTVPLLCGKLLHVPVETVLKIIRAWQAAR